MIAFMRELLPGLLKVRVAVILFTLACTVSVAEVPPDPDEWFEQALETILASEDEAAVVEERHQALLDKAWEEGRIPVIVWLRVELVPEAALDAPGVQAQRERLAAIQQRILDRLSSTAYRSEAELGLKRFVLTPALALQVDALDLEELMADPEVREIIEDRLVPPTLADSVPLIGADSTGAFSGHTGQGQVVAILDTGVDKNHPFLSGKVVSEACYSSNTSASTSLCPGGVTESTANDSGLNCDASISGCDHGTHVAGIAAGSGSSFAGVAKDAGLIAIQVFSRFDSTDFCSSPPCVLSWQSDQIKGLERVHALRNTYDIASANMSLGGGRYFSACDGEPQKPAIDNLRAAGIATAISSGNNGYTDSISAPACISTAVSVGSTTKSDTVSSFSNSADFLDLLAPGSSINSSVPGGGFAFFNGTSMAAPHVAGAWAVLKEAEPSASVVDVLNALKDTGVPITDTRSGANNRVKPRIQVDAPGYYTDVPDTHLAYDAITDLSVAGIIAGCDATRFCPNQPLDRATLAQWLLSALEGGSYLPPAASGLIFEDVDASDFNADWIETLATRNITEGCTADGLRYCPSDLISRASLSALLLKTLFGSDYSPATALGTVFDDVSTSDFNADWIEDLWFEGITDGCDANRFCPNQPITRAEGALWLYRAFGP